MGNSTRRSNGIMSSAWVCQDDKQVKKHGPDAASWYVG
jgi:hypothetical protein